MAASPTSTKPRPAAAAISSKTHTAKAASKVKATTKKAAAKNTKTKAAAPKSSKKLSVQAQLTALEARLKRADAITRKNVKTLEQLVAALEAQTKGAQSAQKASFTRKVNAINKKITTLMESNRAAISNDLSAALSASYNESETLNELSAALERSEARISHAEISQADAIRKINRHLANLATALEARFDDEQAARNAAITASENKLKTDIDTKTAALQTTLEDKTAQIHEKVTHLETDMAAALETLGSKVETFATELENRQGRIDTQMGGKLSEVALQTQTEFETFRDHMDTRLEDISNQVAAVEKSNPNQVSQFDGQINILQNRLDYLEQYLADIKLEGADGQDGTASQNLNILDTNIYAPLQTPAQLNTPNIAAPLPTQTHNLTPHDLSNPVMTQMPTAQIQSDQISSNVVPISDAFTPAAYANMQADLPVNPYAQSHATDPLTHNAAKTPEFEAHIPVEFDPASYQSAAELPALTSPMQSSMQSPGATSQPAALAAAMPPPIIAQAVTTPPPIQNLSPELPPMGASGSMTSHALAQNPERPQGLDPLADITSDYLEPSLPYADPAYAENESPRAERISQPLAGLTGVGLKGKKSLAKLPLSSSPLRFLLMGSAMAILAIFAGKVILGGTDKYAPIPDKAALHSPADLNPNTALTAQADALATDVQDGNFTIEDATQPPIGQYAENITPEITGAEKTSLEAAAADGNPIAQYQLGITHLKASEADPTQLDKAVKLIRAAAAQNLPPAQYRLAKLYEIGQGVQIDSSQARQLTQRAANSGHRIAMHDLALYYMDGRGGIDIDVATAEHWFEQAALHGVVDSQFNLAVLAESKKGADRNIDEAYFWYNIAGKQGDQIAQKRVHTIYEGLTPEQVSAAQSRIAAFKPRPVNPEVNGVFRDVPWQTQETSSNQSVKIERIREVQSYLAELGYEIGPVDGSMGPRTRAAITEFEKLYELPETGTVNDALINQLELAIGA